MNRKQIKEKFTNFLETKAIPLGTNIMTFGFLMSSMSVYAAGGGEAAKLLGAIIDLLCKLIIALGSILALMGVIHYAAANSEGDGPAKHKAIMQIASGIMLVVLSSALLTAKDQFTSIITS